MNDELRIAGTDLAAAEGGGAGTEELDGTSWRDRKHIGSDPHVDELRAGHAGVNRKGVDRAVKRGGIGVPGKRAADRGAGEADGGEIHGPVVAGGRQGAGGGAVEAHNVATIDLGHAGDTRDIGDQGVAENAVVRGGTGTRGRARNSDVRGAGIAGKVVDQQG